MSIRLSLFQRILTFLIVASVIREILPAGQSDLRFEHLSLEQGLSQSSVFAITQDTKGFMWFATQDGLNRYDGYTFLHFEHHDHDSTSLSDNYVTTLLCDHAGTLWAGTRGGGLDRFVPRTGTFVRYRSSAGDPRSLSNDEVRWLYEDHEGTLWVGTTGGLDRYDRKADAFDRYEHSTGDSRSIPAGLVQSLFEDRKGSFWVGMLGSLVQLNRRTGEFTRMKLPARGLLVNSISEDDAGDLWVALQNTLYLLTNGRWVPASSKLHLRAPLLTRIAVKDHDGRIWFGADNGLNVYDERTGSMRTVVNDPSDPLSLSGNSILSIFEDREGIVWIGTYNGINKYAPAQFKFRHVQWRTSTEGSGPWNKVRSFCEDGYGRIWVATQAGLMWYDRQADRLTRVSTNSWYTSADDPRLLWSLVQDVTHNHTIWIGTNGRGLLKMRIELSGRYNAEQYLPRRGDSTSLSGPSPVTLYETRNGTLWVGNLWEGLDRYNGRTGRFTHYVHDPDNVHSISGNEIWAMCEDRSGNLWIGTGGEGLNKLDPSRTTFTQFHHRPEDSLSLSDDKVTSIVEDNDGILWIGTYTGLNRLYPHAGAFEHFTTRDGLPNNVIYGIVDDREGNLWLSTNKGLSRFTPETKTFRNYEAGDGLQSNEFNHGAAYRCRDGTLLFGGVSGFNIFRPSEIVEDTTAPSVVLTDFKVFNKSVRAKTAHSVLSTDISDAERIDLTYREAVLTFDFAALGFSNPVKNQYTYTMEGFDKGWVYSGSRREATYTNLDPGTYVFRVKAANGDGFWNQRGTSTVLVITPPYWQTWWFRTIAILLFLSVGPSIYYKRVSVLKKKQAVQQDFSRKLIESQEAERKRVAAELHDSIGQDLLVIKNRLLLGLQAGQNSGESVKDFEDAVEHVTSSLKHVREISKNLRPIQLDQIGLTAALESAVETAAESAKLQSSVRIDKIDNLLSKEEEINLFRIVQESMNNIMKHAQASELIVSVKKSEQSLSLEIEDNGKGMERPAGVNHRNGLGLNSMTERARILGGELRFDSVPGRGTKVTLIVPLQERRRG